jgi:hypothetical protein
MGAICHVHFSFLDLIAIGQGKATHRKYRRLKFGGGQAYNRTSDSAVVVA